MTSKLRISAVQPVAGKHALDIEWNNGKRHTVDVTEHIKTFPVLKPLKDLKLFGKVELGFTRRTITAYSSGKALIPKHVGLACKGWEYEHKGHDESCM
ncbi:DUF2442 domain-containing protein [Pseudomonas fluorescens]|jgi:hypothetical protein|uniref:Uncharacterized protein n=1 Tax=Pseudomonas fluorescens TaxID=294 RepID=A0A5E7RJX5_PSEFL|nr:DUF2442 domain-containing protein [Pseudomonas fluorescens]VVP74244.1 hypothetical protein PS928_00093 [Pseudomonas fluorescens]